MGKKVFKTAAIIFLVFSILINGYIVPNAADTNDTEIKKRKIVTMRKGSNKNLSSFISRFKHYKVKKLDEKEAEVVMMSDDEAKEMQKSDPDIKVYEDCVVKLHDRNKNNPATNTQETPWGVKRVNAEAMWPKATGEKVKVAVLDTGIDLKHKDLMRNIKGGYNAIDRRQSATDDNGHGTHVAGTIAAKNNRQGVVGVAPNTWLYSVKVLDSYGEGYISDVVEGIEWCIRHKIKVINMSFGIGEDMPILKDSIIEATQHGIIVVAAAGNNYGSYTIDYPAAYQEVISVSGTDNIDFIGDFSPRGKIDFVAPGVDIYSTYLNNDYSSLEGTSMATPHITGIIVLIISSKGASDLDSIKNKLISYCVDLGDQGYDDCFGFGLPAFSN